MWLLVGIIPAATARETPHALRIETTLPMFQIIIAYGFINSMIFLKERIHKSWLYKVVVYVYYLYCSEFCLLFICYYMQYSREYSGIGITVIHAIHIQLRMKKV